MDKNFLYKLQKYKHSQADQNVTSNFEKRLHEIYPKSLAEFISKNGLMNFHDGLFQLCNPDEFRSLLALIFKADPDFNHNECHIVGYTAFGVLECWSNKLYSFHIELPLSALYCPALTWKNWAPTASLDHMSAGTIPDAEQADFLDAEGEPMYERCVAQYGSLAPGECFGFVPALAFGGAFGPTQSVEHIRKMSALEHFTILAQLEQFQLVVAGSEDIISVRPIG